MKFMKVSVVVAGILLITSGLISCVAGGTNPIEEITIGGCIDPALDGEDLDRVPEPTSHSSDKQSPKAPVQDVAGCTDPNLNDD
jgi:hypothetical protein